MNTTFATTLAQVRSGACLEELSTELQGLIAAVRKSELINPHLVVQDAIKGITEEIVAKTGLKALVGTF